MRRDIQPAMVRPASGETRPEGGATGAPPPRLSRAQFADRLRAGYGPLWSIAAAVLNNRAHADDVLQEAAMIAMQKLEQFDPATSFHAWMGQIVRNVARNHARKIARSPVRAVGDKPLESARGAQPSPQDAWSDEHLLAALDELPEDARACLVLRTVHGMAYADIARALDMPEGTAMSHVHRARARLRQRLTQAHGARTEAPR